MKINILLNKLNLKINIKKGQNVPSSGHDWDTIRDVKYQQT